MTEWKIDNQDLADQELAEEFSHYLGEVSAKIFTPVTEYSKQLEKKLAEIERYADAVVASHENGREKLNELLESHEKQFSVYVTDVSKKALSPLPEAVKEVTNATHEIKLAAGSVGAEHARTRTELSALLDEHRLRFGEHIAAVAEQVFASLKAYGDAVDASTTEIAKIVGQIAGGHDETRQQLIGLLEQHQKEAHEWASSHASGIRTELGDRLQTLLLPVEQKFDDVQAQQLESLRAIVDAVKDSLTNRVQALHEQQQVSFERSAQSLEKLAADLAEQQQSQGSALTLQLRELADAIRSEAARDKQDSSKRQNLMLAGVGCAVLLQIVMLGFALFK